MNSTHIKLLLTFFVMLSGLLLPGVFVSLATSQQDMLLYLPWLLFTLVIILSHYFKQGRSGFAALTMMLAYYCIQDRLQMPLYVGSARFEFYFMVLFVPINLLLFTILPERPVFSVKGLWYVAFLLWQMVLFSWLVSSDNYPLIKTILASCEPWLYNLFDFTPLPALLLAALVCSILIAVVLLLFRNLASDQAFLSSQIAFALTVIFFGEKWISVSMFTMSAGFLLFGLLHRSHEQAFIDELTLVPGRRALNSDMAQLGGRYTIAMMDIDHFKKFNDTYGHNIGDNVLSMVATQLSQVKGRGKVYRYGGEEFTILFKGRLAQDCVLYLEEIRKLIADYPFRVRDNDVRPDNEKSGLELRSAKPKADVTQVTISIGVADSTSGASSPSEVIKLADKSLYEAKQKGRNRVCCR